ncbi:hypothetical protein evm_007262 [Chilo suppressalis]|nr:hypothetical protein evm_007262 [Chilo suppressalis]
MVSILTRFSKPKLKFDNSVSLSFSIRNEKERLMLNLVLSLENHARIDTNVYGRTASMTGKSESLIVNEGFKNDRKLETPGKTGKADQRKKWSHKEPWPDAFSEDTYH